jgi:hypothetical protein
VEGDVVNERGVDREIVRESSRIERGSLRCGPWWDMGKREEKL